MTNRRRPPLAAVALVAVLAALWPPAPLAAAEQTRPLALGSAGLTLDLTLWTQASPGAQWTEASTAGVTVSELGGGGYVVGNLPTATGTVRYALWVALASAPNDVLAEAHWGAQPGTRIVWRQELSLPPQPLVFKVDDTYGSIALQVLRRLPAAACEPTTTATFSAWSLTAGAALFTGRAATISDCALEANTSTYGATLTYDLQSGDTAASGRYLGEFTLCYAVDSCHTLPADNRLEWRVVEDFD